MAQINSFKFEIGTKVIVTMIDGERVEGEIVKRDQFINPYYKVRFPNTYTRKNRNEEVEIFDSMDCIPEDKIEKR